MTKAVQEISRGTRPACSKCLPAALEVLVKQKRMAKTQAVPTPFAQAGPLPEFLTGDEGSGERKRRDPHQLEAA